jgi:hypothetical protein
MRRRQGRKSRSNKERQNRLDVFILYKVLMHAFSLALTRNAFRVASEKTCHENLLFQLLGFSFMPY